MEGAVLTPPQSTEVRALYDLLATLKDPDAHAQRLDELNAATAKHNAAAEEHRQAVLTNQQTLQELEKRQSEFDFAKQKQSDALEQVRQDILQREAALKRGNEKHAQDLGELRRTSAEVAASAERARAKEKSADERLASIEAREQQLAEAQQRYRESCLQFEAKVKAVKDLATRLSQT